MNIVLLGAPGTGKGTQAHFIAELFRIPIISPGDILRHEIKNRTKLGMIAKNFVKSGKLVPDNVIVDMIKKRVENKNAKSGFVLDGFPRNLSQAKALEEMLESIGKSIDKAIYFDMEEKKIVARLSGRRVCIDCGETYHLQNNPPIKDNICDKCGGHLYQREDDKPKIIEERLGTYNRNTAPIIDYYSKKDYFLAVNADDNIESIRNNLRREFIP
ncbi:MAG: adenylate kinase [Spirochaetota bacterium]|nr:MAG: adenylate kinase [Spirochaetota bacterium]